MASDFKSQSSKLFLAAGILVALSIYFFRESISLFPSYIHAWTQSDRYALVFGFLENGFDFFHPQTMNLLTVDGITRVDFPVHEYVVALLMKLTGVHEPVVFRLYTLTYACIGLIFLFRLSALFTQAFSRNLLAVLFLFLCPVYLYYADGFIPSIPSLSNLLIGYFFYFRYRQKKSTGDFRMAIFFLTLGALARLPFFIFHFAVFCQQLPEYFRNKKINRNEAFAFGISFGFFIGYQLYNIWLGKKYGTQFLVSFLPAKNRQQLSEWIVETWTQWRFEYFTKAHYAMLGILAVCFLVLLLHKKNLSRMQRDLFVQLGIAAAGSIIYFLLMLKQFPDHDYYFIDAFYPLVALLLPALVNFSFDSKILNTGFLAVMAALLFMAFTQAKEVLDKRYVTGYWDRVELSRQNFTGAGKFLDSIGIAKDAKVLVLDGYTTNVPLILMNRKGWTVNWTLPERIEEGMSKPFDLVAIQNAFVASDVVKNAPGLVSRLEKFADNGLVSFYQKNRNPTQPFDRFFGIDSSTALFVSAARDSISADASTEFVELFADTASKYVAGQPAKALLTGKIRLSEGTAPELAASVTQAENTAWYFSFDLDRYTDRTGGWQPLLFQFVMPRSENPAGIVKMYFWNNGKARFTLTDLRLVIYR
jgi:hypothetical protein